MELFSVAHCKQIKAVISTGGGNRCHLVQMNFRDASIRRHDGSKNPFGSNNPHKLKTGSMFCNTVIAVLISKKLMKLTMYRNVAVKLLVVFFCLSLFGVACKNQELDNKMGTAPA